VKGLVAKYLLLDTQYWIDLLCAERSSQDAKLDRDVERAHVLVPWPTLYEFLNTKLSKRGERVDKLRDLMKGAGIARIDDSPYRERALEEWLGPEGRRRPMSLVDRVLRGIASDKRVRLDAIVSMNKGDFEDVCKLRHIELLPS